MEGEFTALMLHQCAAVVAVNLQIDQTAQPKGSQALSQSKGSTESNTHIAGVSDGRGYQAPIPVSVFLQTQIADKRAHVHARTRTHTGKYTCRQYILYTVYKDGRFWGKCA